MKPRTKNICSIICATIFMILSLFLPTAYGESGECPFSNVNGTTVRVCFVPYTGAIFTEVKYLKNSSYPFDTSWSTFNPINQGTFLVHTSTGTNIWFRVSIGTAMSGSIFWSDSFGPTGATGATGPTGATGSQGNDGYNAFEVAQILGYTGTVTEWLESLRGPIGATGSLDFSSFSGAVNLQNIVNIPDDDGTLSTGSTYIPTKTIIDGTEYWNIGETQRLLIRILYALFITVIFAWMVYGLFFKKKRYE